VPLFYRLHPAAQREKRRENGTAKAQGSAIVADAQAENPATVSRTEMPDAGFSRVRCHFPALWPGPAPADDAPGETMRAAFQARGKFTISSPFRPNRPGRVSETFKIHATCPDLSPCDDPVHRESVKAKSGPVP
jgi:hypothetical protein